MSVRSDGTGFLEITGAGVVSAYPFSMMMWVAVNGTAADSAWLSKNSSSTTARSSIIHQGQSLSTYISSDGDSGVRNAAPEPDATMRLAVAVFASASSRVLYFNDSTPYSSSVTVADTVSTQDRITIGAAHSGASAPNAILNGSMAEVHFFNVALTATDVTNLRTSGGKPELISGWVDGWTLYDASTLTSIGGTRTLTVTGSISNTGAAAWNLYGRTASGASGATINATPANNTASGIPATIVAPMPTIINAIIGGSVAAGLPASLVNYIQTGVIPNNSGSIYANQAVVWTWTPNGRVGSMVGLTPQDGTGTTDSAGRLTVPIAVATGRLSVAVRNSSAATDDIFEQYF